VDDQDCPARPTRGLAFSTFAVPTIVGEIRRHFRDRTWSVHVQRALQERTGRVERCVRELTQEPAVASRSRTVHTGTRAPCSPRHTHAAARRSSTAARRSPRATPVTLALGS